MVTGAQYRFSLWLPAKSLMVVWLAFMTLLPQISVAESTLSASVDRNKLYETETLTYELRGELDVEPGFGGLFSFGRSQINEPEIPGLERDFEILDRQQKMSMQSINGKTQSQVLWRYTLAPKRSGTLTIPAAEYENIKAKPISIEVLAGTSPREAGTPPLVFIEVETDKTTAYVQEQIKYTVRLYSSGNLVAGDLDQPQALDAIVEPLGETKVYYRMAHNQRYEVREKNYLLFPQKSGQLDLPALKFSGTVIDSSKRRRVRVRETSEGITLNVNPPPASFSGDVWLPATSLHLSEKWDRTPDDLKVGDSVTRTVEIQALGLLASALPPLPATQSTHFKVYPDQPQTETVEHDGGAQSLRRETRALVAVQPGELTLPEVRVPWWDTVNNLERVAVLPARSLSVTGLAARASKPPHPASAEITAQNNEDSSAAQASGAKESAPASEPSSLGPSQHFWWLITALLLSGWALTVWWFLRKPHRQQDTSPAFTPSNETWHALQRAIKHDDPEMTKLLVAWARQHFGERGISRAILGITDLQRLDSVLYAQASAFEAARYAPNGKEDQEYDRKILLDRLKLLRDKSPSAQQTAVSFYPTQKRA